MQYTRALDMAIIKAVCKEVVQILIVIKQLY